MRLQNFIGAKVNMCMDYNYAHVCDIMIIALSHGMVIIDYRF